MKEWFRHIILRFHLPKIRRKYLAVMMILSISPLFILGLISYSIAKDTLVHNQMQANKDHLKTASEVADLLFRNIINMERLISWNKDITQALKDSAAYRGDEPNVLGESTTRRIETLLMNYLIDTRDIDSVCLFDARFHSVCYGNSDSIGKYGYAGTYGEIAHTDWYHRSNEAQGKVIFFGRNVLNDAQSSNTFSSVKLLRDPERVFDTRTIGLLVVNIKKSMFSRVSNESDNNKFFVLHSSGQGVNAVYNAPPSFGSEVNLGSDISSVFQKLGENGYLSSSYTNQTTGWTFVHVIKEKELLKQSNQIGIVTALISFIIALIFFLLSFKLSGTIAHPLLRLRNMALEWKKGLWSYHEGSDKDEIAVIGETFQRITVEHKELSEQLVRSQLKEREAELRALQAQIKPHFLYNTLDSIYWMAVMQNNQEIAKMAVSLSESFKLSLNNGQDMIPVSKELEHIKHYMTIQNIRYNNRFQYIEDVDPALIEKEMLKLLLQPLVENSIYHGLEPKVGEGTIRLTGRIENGWVIFTVSDDGVGIADMEATEKGYGLRNVRERLHFCYGPDSTLTISSAVNQGTSMEIRFRDNAKEG